MFVDDVGSYHWSCDRDCLRGSILNTDDAEVRCPFAEYQCNSIITEREIRGVSEQTQHMYVCMYCTGLPLVAIHDNTLLPHTVQPAVGPPQPAG